MSASTCHLLTLPPELREEIYKYTFTTNGSEAYESLLRTGPDNSLRATCRFIYHDSNKTHKSFVAVYDECRSETLAAMAEQAAELMRAPGANYLRANGLDGATNRLSCEHTCTHDAFACSCRQHENCFTCGRWLALAVFYELHPDYMTMLKLVRDDGSLTRQGHVIETSTPELRIGSKGEHSWDFTERYPDRMQSWRFGQSWWRFELERQKMPFFAARVQLEALEMLGEEDLWCDSSPIKGMSDEHVRRVLEDLKKARDWPQVCERNLVAPDECKFDYADWIDDIELIINARSADEAARIRKVKAEKKKHKKGKK